MERATLKAALFILLILTLVLTKKSANSLAYAKSRRIFDTSNKAILPQLKL